MSNNNQNKWHCLFCSQAITLVTKSGLIGCEDCQVAYSRNYYNDSLQFLEFKIKPHITLFYNVEKQMAIIYSWKNDNWNIEDFFYEDNDSVKKIFSFNIDFCERSILTRKALSCLAFS